MPNNRTKQRNAGAPPDAWASPGGRYQPSTGLDAPPITPAPSPAYLASLLLAALMATISAAGLLLTPTGLYGREPSRVAVFAGQDAANLLVGLPLLLGTVWLARRGSLVGLLLRPGALYYVLYTYALYLVGAPFNAFFLGYVALTVLSTYTTIGVVARIDAKQVRQHLSRVPATAIGGALIGIGLLATVGLAALVVPALADPASVDPLLHARWIVDFTVGNPVLLIGGALLWRRARLGYAIAGGLLFLSGTNGIGFAVGGVFGALLAATPVDEAVIAVHLLIAAVCLVLLAVFLRGAERPLAGEAKDQGRGPARREAVASPAVAAALSARRD